MQWPSLAKGLGRDCKNSVGVTSDFSGSDIAKDEHVGQKEDLHVCHTLSWFFQRQNTLGFSWLCIEANEPCSNPRMSATTSRTPSRLSKDALWICRKALG